MSGTEKMFIYVLIINALVTLLYLLIQLLFMKKESKRGCCLKALVMFICPVIGPFCILFAYVIFRLFFRIPVDLEDVIFSKERVKAYGFADEERECNLVPLEEAIAVSDRDSLRRLMMDVVKEDKGESLAAISKGLYSDDSETSHYAASILQEKLGEFRKNAQRRFDNLRCIENELIRADRALDLLNYLNEMLKKNVLGQSEQIYYVNMLDQVMEMLIESKPEKVEADYYNAVCSRALEIDEIEIAEKWCDILEKEFPNEQMTYTCKLELYFKTGRHEQFRNTLEELKKSKIVVDAKTLEVIRTFN